MFYDPSLSRQGVSRISSVAGYRLVSLETAKLGEELGRGASGSVQKALCGGYFFAAKKIALRKNCDERRMKEELLSLKREIDLLRNLDHERVVRFIGSTLQKEEGSLILFLEYCPTGSMSSVLTKFGAYEAPLARKYMRQVLEGIAFLHSRGIVHRDLKAANILLSETGDAKISDLGAVNFKRIESDLNPKNSLPRFGAPMPRTGKNSSFEETCVKPSNMEDEESIRGSVYWMAPESIMGIVGRRSDIWSAGCLCVEMLTAEHPWALHPRFVEEKKGGAAEALQWIVTHIEERPPEPPKADAQCCRFLDLCLQRDHRSRPYADALLKHEFILE